MLIEEARVRARGHSADHEHRQVVLAPELVVRASTRLQPLNGVA